MNSSPDELPGMWDHSDLAGGWADSTNEPSEVDEVIQFTRAKRWAIKLRVASDQVEMLRLELESFSPAELKELESLHINIRDPSPTHINGLDRINSTARAIIFGNRLANVSEKIRKKLHKVEDRIDWSWLGSANRIQPRTKED